MHEKSGQRWLPPQTLRARPDPWALRNLRSRPNQRLWSAHRRWGRNSCFSISQAYNSPKYPTLHILFTATVHHTPRGVAAHNILPPWCLRVDFSLKAGKRHTPKRVPASPGSVWPLLSAGPSVAHRASASSVLTAAFPDHPLFPIFIPRRRDLLTSLPISCCTFCPHVTAPQLKSVRMATRPSFSTERRLPCSRLAPSSLCSADAVDSPSWNPLPLTPPAEVPSSSPAPFQHLPLPTFKCPVRQFCPWSCSLSPPRAARPTSCSSWAGSALHTSILCTSSLPFWCVCSTGPLAQGPFVLQYVQFFLNCFLILTLS